MTESIPPWVEQLCRLPRDFWQGGVSTVYLIEQAAPNLSDRAQAVALIRAELVQEPSLAHDWQTFAYDNRGTPAPYLDGTEVGDFEHGVRSNVERHADAFDACADYIYRRASQALDLPAP